MKLPWDPSQRPRKPRIRTTHHFVPSPEQRRTWFERPSLRLSGLQLGTLAQLVPSILPREMLCYLIGATAQQFGWERKAAAPARAMIRYELRLMAHLCWKHVHRRRERNSVERELWQLVGTLDEISKEMLFDAIRKAHPDGCAPVYYIYGPAGLDRMILLEGACIADLTMASRGDYRDVALHKAVAFLIFIFDFWAGELPALSRSEVGPVSASGTRKTIASSTFSEFAYAFFQYVDPELSKSRITSAIEARLSELRKRRTSGESEHHDLVNLLH